MFTRTTTVVTLLALSLIPSFVTAGLFPKNGPVTNLDETGFRKVMKDEQTSIVAFVAPWCGYCKQLQPEFIKAAKSLEPIIPFYAVDCDAEENKRLCAEQEVKGFPTIKSFPRGGKSVSHVYQGERKSGPIVKYMADEVPNRVTALKSQEKINEWIAKDTSVPRALLLTPKARSPVMWKVLQNKFNKRISFGAAKDEDGSIASAMGVEGETKEKTHVLVWASGQDKPVAYEGSLKFDPLFKHFKSVLEGGSNRKDEL